MIPTGPPTLPIAAPTFTPAPIVTKSAVTPPKNLPTFSLTIYSES
ncbi:hypothetical protein AB1L05_23705 [Cytobacillus horneckiae]